MYAESKVKLFMLTAELQRRLRATGSSTDVFSVHPGVAQTDIFPKSDTEKLGANVLAAGAVAVGQSPGGGAQSVLKVATDPHLTGIHIVGCAGFSSISHFWPEFAVSWHQLAKVLQYTRCKLAQLTGTGSSGGYSQL